ncbi:MAG: hypothetical protein M1356_02050 [Gammaproteobacteria bacterium]|nr:hypothetical protein [Gammaproteobacteria bacterium]
MKQLLIVACCLLLVVGCAKQPTRLTGVVNDAPTVNFKVENPRNLNLWVDGVDFGPIASYTYPHLSVELLPGEHLIEVRNGMQVIYSQTHYFSEHTHRTLEVNR